MSDWIFMWASRRPFLWDNFTNNMNLALTEEYAIPSQYFPANSNNIAPSHLDRVPNLDAMKGQVLDQFEAESFKYVIEPTESGNLLLKENLRIPILTNETNSRLIDLNEITLYLEKYKWVGLGVILSNIEISDKTIVAKAFYYTRDPKTLQIINLSGENQPHDHEHLPVITYMTFTRSSDYRIFTAVVNPNLVSIANVDTMMLGNNRITTLNTFEDGISSFFVKPKVVGAKFVSNDVIFAENDFQIHEYIGSGFNIRTGVVPNFPRVLNTNFHITQAENVLNVTLNQSIGFISLEYDIDAMINMYDDRSIAGKHRVDFLVVRG
jgi:hypothetical protein